MKLIILSILLLYAVKAIVIIVIVTLAYIRLNNVVNEIYAAKSDERLKRNFIIELNKMDCSLDEDLLFRDFLNPIKGLDSSRWLAPETLEFLEEEYSSTCKKNET